MTDAEPTYEQARDELVHIVATLETGGTTLEESLRLWKRGEELAALCERYLEGARRKLDAAQADNQSPPAGDVPPTDADTGHSSDATNSSSTS